MLIPSWVKYVSIFAAFYAGWLVHSWYAASIEVKTAQHVAVVTEKRADATNNVDNKGVKREASQAVVYRTINKEVTRYVEKRTGNAACVLDSEWVRLHDSAATATVPDATGENYVASNAAK